MRLNPNLAICLCGAGGLIAMIAIGLQNIDLATCLWAWALIPILAVWLCAIVVVFAALRLSAR